jgi:integrase
MSGNLSARKAATAGAGKHSDGGGLYLFVSPEGRRWWNFLFTIDGKRRTMSLGPFRDLPLAEARDAATSARKLVRAGVDPITDRRRGSKSPTFGEVAGGFIDSRKGVWRGKWETRWRTTLERYAAPIWDMPVDKVQTEDVLKCLKPIWLEKHETARRLRMRIEAVLAAAKTLGHRDGENPAAWKFHLEHLLPKHPASARAHFAALPYADLPHFIVRLRGMQDKSMSALAFEFLILTAARTNEALGMRWDEVDFDARLWIVPASRAKSSREHRVPLSDRALAILKTLNEIKTGDFVFPSPRGPRPMAHVALQQVLRRAKVSNATPHGMRSSFRDWAGDVAHAPREIAEACLAHIVGGVEGAYRRSDALEKRRALMDSWAAYLEGAPRESNVVSMQRSPARTNS